jgi:hypothetical protein
MITQTIEVEGLPEGWNVVAYRKPSKGEQYLHQGLIWKAFINESYPYLIVEKIQPSRIVLEFTGEIRKANPGDWWRSFPNRSLNYNDSNSSTSDEYEIWREVKENDIPLTKDEPKLSLSVSEAREIYTYNIFINQKIIKFINENS